MDGPGFLCQRAGSEVDYLLRRNWLGHVVIGANTNGFRRPLQSPQEVSRCHGSTLSTIPGNQSHTAPGAVLTRPGEGGAVVSRKLRLVPSRRRCCGRMHEAGAVGLSRIPMARNRRVTMVP